MNKDLWLACVTILGLTMTSAVASAADSEPGFYIGAGLGEATLEIDDTDFDDGDTAFKLFGGYRFNPYFGIELAYLDGGTAQQTDRDFPATIEIETTAVNLSAIVTAPFGDNFALFGKLGYASLDFELTANFFGTQAFSDDDTDEEISFGAGASDLVNDYFSLRAEYEAFDLNDADAGLATISAVFRF